MAHHGAAESVGNGACVRQFAGDTMADLATFQARYVGGTGFGSEQTVDGVRIESPLDCTVACFGWKRRARRASGKRYPQARRLNAVESSSFMGKAAMREFKARGFDYLFMRNSEPGWAEIHENPEAWGLTLLGDAEQRPVVPATMRAIQS
jgi:hypothetical protein